MVYVLVLCTPMYVEVSTIPSASSSSPPSPSSSSCRSYIEHTTTSTIVRTHTTSTIGHAHPNNLVRACRCSTVGTATPRPFFVRQILQLQHVLVLTILLRAAGSATSSQPNFLFTTGITMIIHITKNNLHIYMLYNFNCAQTFIHSDQSI